MSPDQRRTFLLEGTRTAKVATTRTDGRPHVAPVWFDLEGEQVLFWTDASSVKGRNIQWNPQVAICVDDDHPPFAFVLLEGRASIISDPDEVRECAQRIAARYLGVEDGRAFVERAFGIGDIIVRVPPEHVVALYPVVG
ncbi:MAG: hypothetical protein QOJ19_1453 [Acidimicrobiia bacterium]|jgi:PPOX class probable F420-dependent enzyme|nr:hypothetical protein [Acidimicrobiia bacterium]